MFVKILIYTEENGRITRIIKEILTESKTFKENNLFDIINYLSNVYDILNKKQKRLIYDLFLSYEYDFFSNKNFDQQKDIIQIFINFLDEIDRKIQTEEESSEILLASQKKIQHIYNEIFEEMCKVLPPHFLILLLALIKRRIGKDKFNKMVFSNFKRSFQRKFAQKISGDIYRFIESFRNLEINDDLKAIISDIMRNIYKSF